LSFTAHVLLDPKRAFPFRSNPLVLGIARQAAIHLGVVAVRYDADYDENTNRYLGEKVEAWPRIIEICTVDVLLLQNRHS
jgi:hypothetical protein